ncbi:MAG: patatin-like phospholipase family protein [Neisseriaceae bacterium]
MGKQIFLLSVDGGGVRGKIVATFLALLEKDLGATIYNTFDFFAGTSTGALITLGIAANQYSGSTISNLYEQPNLGRIFKKSLLYVPYVFGAKYQGESKSQVFNEIFGTKRILDIPKTALATAYDFMNDKAVVFKSTKGTDSQFNPLISEVADATTAAPTYFPSVVTTEYKPRNLIDGGIIANNPSMCLISEALKQGYSLQDIKLLSFGTGVNVLENFSDTSKNWGGVRWLKNGLIDDLMLGDSSLAEYHSKMLLGKSYLRINGSLGKASDALDDITDANLANLEEAGQQWYNDNKKSLLEFFNI